MNSGRALPGMFENMLARAVFSSTWLQCGQHPVLPLAMPGPAAVQYLGQELEKQRNRRD
ncbi:MAG TPA: hypothetical protein VGM05_04990 [Planctomycetaceae bacterium]